MANTKISALASGNPAQGADIIPIDRAGANFSLTAASVAALGLASPAFTGTPTAPTAAPTVASTQLATTAFSRNSMPDPRTFSWFFDDFYCSGGTVSTSGLGCYVLNGGGTPSAVSRGITGSPGTAVASTSGAITWTTTATINTVNYFSMSDVNTALSGGGPLCAVNALAWSFRVRLRVGTLTNERIRMGLIDQLNEDAVTPANGMYFEVINTASAGTWKCGTSSASTGTLTTSSPAQTCDSNYHDFEIRSDGAGNITFYVDGTLVATNNTNVTNSASLKFIIMQNKNTDAVAKSMDIDYFGWWIALSR